MKRLREMLDASPNPAFATDGRDRVLACNPAAERLLGCGRERVVGKVLHEAVEIREAFAGRLGGGSPTLSQMVAGGEPIPSLHFAVRDTRGELVPVAVSATAVLGSGPADERLVYHLTPRPYRRRTDLAIVRLLARDLASGPGTSAFRRGDDRAPRLTGRETEVLRLVAAGRSTVEICGSLEISPHTVRSHVRSLLRKLGCKSRAEAISVALRLRLV